MNELDAALLSLLIKDSRLSFADIARQLGCSRAHARARVQALLEEGTVEQFTAVVNPEKLGKVLSIVFASIALLVAANMAFRNKAQPVADKLPGSPAKQLMGVFIGGFSTLMGIGGGTLSVPILNAFNVPMHRAVGTAAAIGMVISIPGAIGFLLNGWGVENTPPLTIGYINLIGFALIVPMTMWMAPIGARMASATTAARLKLAFAFFLFITAVRMLYGVLA